MYWCGGNTFSKTKWPFLPHPTLHIIPLAVRCNTAYKHYIHHICSIPGHELWTILHISSIGGHWSPMKLLPVRNVKNTVVFHKCDVDKPIQFAQNEHEIIEIWNIFHGKQLWKFAYIFLPTGAKKRRIFGDF